VPVTTADDTYEAYALRFGTTALPKASRYHRYATYGEPDATVSMDFFFWLVRNNQRTILVDCGFDAERGRAKGFRQDVDPLDLLARLDVRAEEVEHVVLSHMHFDHIGNIGLFPNATFSIARAEFEFWTGPFADRPHLSSGTEPEEIKAVADLLHQDRLRLVGGAETLFPGIQATTIRGHTAGQMITEVRTARGHVVLASDSIHWYEEMTLDRPFWLFCDLEGMYQGYELLRTLEARPDTVVVAGHDPAVMAMFESVRDECVDLTRRVS
jgi:glyoxylase-like metal-dependent hydrolase (beta-lactamase superfamily II)